MSVREQEGRVPHREFGRALARMLWYLIALVALIIVLLTRRWTVKAT